MSKTISKGFISGKINGISVNSSIPCSSGNYNNAASRTIKYVVMHYTGNSKDTAKSNATYFKTSGRNASAHFFVDDSNIYQSVELRDKAWHCGASSYKHASCRNTNSIGIEMCCTAGNYKISDTTKKNAAYLCAYICDMVGITSSQVDTYVLRHYDVTGKNCPAQMAGSDNAEWTAFKKTVKNILKGETTTTTPSTSSKLPTYTTGKTYTLQKEVYVRKGAGTSYAKVGYSNLTANAKKHDADKDGALDKGTVVTCKGTKTVSGNVWMKIPSGWIAAYYNNSYYVK